VIEAFDMLDTCMPDVTRWTHILLHQEHHLPYATVLHHVRTSATVLFRVSSAHHHIQGGKTHGSIKTAAAAPASVGVGEPSLEQVTE
jgi:hypothetical protein